ncbi:ABC-type transporter ATP-binding protein EcsA [Pirellulimonas nuda]|uniref:ABC-type transporter ATP-binding protein EcsA n=1 Tax=Pirellulimonas nuda TaxID=2528009 RepID=A0A518DB32_9BACT|nr:ABC transporter ATP-binding protein [Pirellulimonas nuda]QDU88700.1 ABC-type transporter ATP-binding protein EcsA [Pirellulimonas nuda]
MIEFLGVSRSYGAKLAVDSLDLSIGRGELFAMLGQNGAGKTTSIKMMVGLLQPGSGSVRIGGRDVVAETRLATSQIGYVPDQPFLYDKLSGREFLRFVAEMHGLSPSQARGAVARESTRFGLDDFIDELTESYSHGMKQRTVFASALLHDPQVLVVDEPMVGLDPQSIRLVKDMLRSQADAGAGVFMSTHTLAAAEEIADKIGVMKRGKLLFVGTLAELRAFSGEEHATLESLYLSLTADAAGAEPPPGP